MKRLLAFALVLMLCISVLASCTTEEVPPVSALDQAVSYVKTVYKTVAEFTNKDFDRIGKVPVGDVTCTVTWSADVSEDYIKIVVAENGMVTIDVNEESPEEVAYVLTATIADPDGNTQTLTFNHILPKAVNVDGMTYAELIDLAYTTGVGVTTDDVYRISGTITKIDTPWSPDYKNITVTITVPGKEDKPMMCYRLKGEGAENLKVGDVITVEGKFTNYNGTIEFASGCALIGMGDIPDQSALLEAAFQLGAGDKLDYPTVMTGTITKIVSAWSDQYGNITVDMQVEDKVVQAYRLKGEGAKDLKVGDKITVAGLLKNYNGTIEYDSGCMLIPNDSYQSAKNAFSGYRLLTGEKQETAKTITGVISSIDTPYSEDYKNITVTIVIGGMSDYKIQCYRLKGEGAEALAVGDTITATGFLKNYNGTIEFDSGCTLDSVAKSEEPAPKAPETVAEILSAAFALEAGDALPYEVTLTGAIASIDTAYSEQYGNITVTITVEDQSLQCFRLKGDGAADLAVGDTITVTGQIKNYNGNVQFNAGCTFTK